MGLKRFDDRRVDNAEIVQLVIRYNLSCYRARQETVPVNVCRPCP